MPSFNIPVPNWIIASEFWFYGNRLSYLISRLHQIAN